MSLSKKKYVLVIIDDFSKNIWVLFLHTKHKSGQMIIDHINKLEKEANFLVGMIRLDNETKFYNVALNDFCTNKGIIRHFSTPKSLQQNEVV